MKEKKVGMAMAMGYYWSDLPSVPLISIARRLEDPGDFARFRTVCRSWESAVRGSRPSFFPWLAAIPLTRDPIQGEVFFISHASEDSVYKRHLPCGGSNLISEDACVNSTEDGWMVFVRKDDRVPIIVNPLTGAQLIQPLPSLSTLFGCYPIVSVTFFSDNNVVFVECVTKYHYDILAAATPGDDEWSATRMSSLRVNSSIVCHETDNKFYILTRNGRMQSFCVVRIDGRKTVIENVSSSLAKSTNWQDSSIDSRLMFDGTNLLQVRRFCPSNKFDVLKYNPDADMWVKMTDMDFGNNALFFDFYRVRMLPLPLARQREGVRRNCVYFPYFKTIQNGKYIHYVGMYDMGKGTVDPSFSPINLQPNQNLSPAFMWFTPSLSIMN